MSSKNEIETGAKSVVFAREMRLIWIDYRLSVGGPVNRADLVEAFWLSGSGAAADLKEYKRRFPDKIRYDTQAKAYYRAGPYSAYDFKVRKAVDQAQKLVSKAAKEGV